MRSSSLRQSRLAYVLAVLVTLTAVAYFLWRGPVRAVAESADLTAGYAAGRAWLAGDDPYDPGILRDHLERAGGGDVVKQGQMDFMRNIYLPVTLPMFVPVSLLPWPVARVVWMLVSTGGLLVIVGGVLQLAGVPLCSRRSLWLMVLALVLAPVHTAIASGQASIVSVMLLVLALVQERADRPWWAGLLYGLTTALKIQIGLPFVAYALWRRRWIPAGGAVVVLLVLTTMSLVRMEAAHIEWQGSRQANVEQTMSNGGYNDAIRGSPGRYTLINLQYLVYDFTDSRLLANGVTVTVVGVLGLLMLWYTRGGHRGEELLVLSTVAVLTLLVVYHRTYDAVLVLIPAAWALAGVGGRRAGTWIRWAVLACCVSFVFPGQVVFRQLGEQGAVPHWITGSICWQATVLCQHVWALLAAGGLLVAAGRSAEGAMTVGSGRALEGG